MPTKQEIRALFADRPIVIALVIVLLLCLVLIVVGSLGLHTSDVQLPIRYSDYGATNTYRDKWFYLLSFPLLGLIIGVTHTLLAFKLLPKNREVAIGFLLTSSVVLIIGIIITAAVLHLVSLSV
jgi:uncharacterized BrkB/YihY/UPF0761 family membrane protein